MNKEYYAPGQDCNCHSSGAHDCICTADWTDPLVYAQQKQIDELNRQLLSVTSELHIANNTIEILNHLKIENTNLLATIKRYQELRMNTLEVTVRTGKENITILNNQNVKTNNELQSLKDNIGQSMLAVISENKKLKQKLLEVESADVNELIEKDKNTMEEIETLRADLFYTITTMRKAKKDLSNILELFNKESSHILQTVDPCLNLI